MARIFPLEILDSLWYQKRMIRFCATSATGHFHFWSKRQAIPPDNPLSAALNLIVEHGGNSLARVCKPAGCATETAEKMAERGEFPRAIRIASKRVVSSVAFEARLRERIGTPATAV